MSHIPVAVIGGGSWGVALAVAAARRGGSVYLYSRRIHDDALPPGVTRAASWNQVGARARLIVLAVPSSVSAGVARELGAHLDGRHFVVHGIRGLVGDELSPVSHVIREETAVRRIGAVGGPALTGDLVTGRPSLLVVGSRFDDVRQAFTDAFAGDVLRVYTTHDLEGLEWASAIVGCLAVAVGYLQATGASPGLIAGFVSRAVAEGARIASTAGGDERTLLGLAGYGDLLACAGQPARPEVMIGAALGSGRSLAEALAHVQERVEAVDLTARILAWANRRGMSTPIFHALAEGMLKNVPPASIIHQLMTAPIEQIV